MAIISFKFSSLKLAGGVSVSPIKKPATSFFRNGTRSRWPILSFAVSADPAAIQELESTQKLTDANKEKLIEILKKYFTANA